MLDYCQLDSNFSEIFIITQIFLFAKLHLKISSAKWRPFCPGGMSLIVINSAILRMHLNATHIHNIHRCQESCLHCITGPVAPRKVISTTRKYTLKWHKCYPALEKWFWLTYVYWTNGQMESPACLNQSTHVRGHAMINVARLIP